MELVRTHSIGHFGLVGVLATAQFCTVNKYVSFWISARHQVRDLGAVQSSHRLIKRLFEACSSLQLVKSLPLLMSCTQYNRTVQSQSQLTISQPDCTHLVPTTSLMFFHIHLIFEYPR